MAKKATIERKSLEEMIAFFGPMFSQARGAGGDVLSIPGDDAYVPSFISGGADQGRANGQLERNPQRNQKVA